MLMKMKVNEFVAELASSSPAPGGGTIAAVTGSFAAGLGAMVCQLTIGNAKYPDAQDILIEILPKLNVSWKRLVSLADEDTAAFNNVMAAFKLPKVTDEDKAVRKKAINQANLEATKIPMMTAEEAIGVLENLLFVVKYGNINALSDCGVAIECSKTAALGALMNVAINFPAIKSENDIAELSSKKAELESRLKNAYRVASDELKFKFVY